ncbi:acetylxylan esterase [Tardisphaera miroshnichenkoae]
MALLYGETAAGMCDAQQSFDILSNLSWIKRIGIMGASSGGALALYLSALDDRIAATAISAYLNTYKDSIPTVRTHCVDNYLPGMLKYAEIHDAAALIAPRPLFAENGIYDPGFPIGGFRVAVEKVGQAYKPFGASDEFESYELKGGHAMTYRPAEFMEKRLVKQPVQ